MMKDLSLRGLVQLAVAAGATTPAPASGQKPLCFSTTTGKPMYWDGDSWELIEGTGGGGGGSSLPEVMVVQFNLSEAADSVFVNDTTLNMESVFLDGVLDPSAVAVAGQKVFLRGASAARHGVFVLGSVANMAAVPITRDASFPVSTPIGGMSFLALRGNKLKMATTVYAGASGVNTTTDSLTVTSSSLFPASVGGMMSYTARAQTWEGSTLPAPLVHGKSYVVSVPDSFQLTNGEYTASVSLYDPSTASYVNFTSTGVDDMGYCLQLIPVAEFGVTPAPGIGYFETGAEIGLTSSVLRAARGGYNTYGHGASSDGAANLAAGDDALAGNFSVNICGEGASQNSVAVGANSRAHDYAVAIGQQARASASSVALGISAIADPSAVALGANSYANQNSVAIGVGSSSQPGEVSFLGTSLGYSTLYMGTYTWAFSGTPQDLVINVDTGYGLPMVYQQEVMHFEGVVVAQDNDPGGTFEWDVGGILVGDLTSTLLGEAYVIPRRCSAGAQNWTLTFSKVTSPTKSFKFTLSVDGTVLASARAEIKVLRRYVTSDALATYTDTLQVLPRGFARATASEALTKGQLVNLWNNGGVFSVRKADAASGKAADGFVLQSASSSSKVVVATFGTNFMLSGLTLGADYFLGNAGAITTSVPSSGLFQRIGKAMSANELLFQRETPIQL